LLKLLSAEKWVNEYKTEILYKEVVWHNVRHDPGTCLGKRKKTINVRMLGLWAEN